MTRKRKTHEVDRTPAAEFSPAADVPPPTALTVSVETVSAESATAAGDEPGRLVAVWVDGEAFVPAPEPPPDFEPFVAPPAAAEPLVTTEPPPPPAAAAPRRYRVQYVGCPSFVCEAADGDAAAAKCREAYGVLSSQHAPSVEETTLPLTELP